MKPPRHSAGRALLVTLAAVALIGLAILLVSRSPQKNTVFAPGYTSAAFATIHVGVPAARVLEVLGDPLSTSIGGADESWQYSRARKSPDHMIIRSVIIDSRMQTVTRVDRRTRFDYIGQVFAGGDAL